MKGITYHIEHSLSWLQDILDVSGIWRYLKDYLEMFYFVYSCTVSGVYV